MLFKFALSLLALGTSILASEVVGSGEDKRHCPRRCQSSSSSSSEVCCRMNYNPAPCTNCGCAPDGRQSCPFLQLPLRTLPSGCVVPQNYFKNKRVLVIGATSGFGLATANLFKSYGAKVVGTSRNPKKAPRVSYPLMKVNMASDEQVDQLIEDYIKKYGCPPDILIDNGANAALGASMDMTNELIEYNMKAIGTGHIRLIQGFIKKLPNKNSPFISLSTTTTLSFTAIPLMTFYNTPKYVLRQFTENWGLENSPVYPNVFLGFVAPSAGNTNFIPNAIWPGERTNPLTAQFKQSLSALLAAGLDSSWVAKAFLEFAYTRSQGQTCDVGYFVGNAITPEALQGDYDFNSFVANNWNNKYPIDYIEGIKNLWAPFGGPIYSYNTTYTQC